MNRAHYKYIINTLYMKGKRWRGRGERVGMGMVYRGQDS